MKASLVLPSTFRHRVLRLCILGVSPSNNVYNLRTLRSSEPLDIGRTWSQHPLVRDAWHNGQTWTLRDLGQEETQIGNSGHSQTDWICVRPLHLVTFRKALLTTFKGPDQGSRYTTRRHVHHILPPSSRLHTIQNSRIMRSRRNLRATTQNFIPRSCGERFYPPGPIESLFQRQHQ